MDTESKKDIFLLILETLFNDKSEDIDSDNCISFYHFLVNTLSNEVKAMPIDADEDISLCNSIINLLCNFDTMTTGVKDWREDSTIEFLKDYSGLTDEEFEISILIFRKLYRLIKEDFILGLT